MPDAGRITAADMLRSLRHHLADMELHDDTGDPFDQGYMAALEDLQDWFEDEGWGQA